MLRPRLLAASVVAGAGLATALWLPTQRDSASAADAITWQDEFNAAAGTPVDSAKWAFETGGSGFGNNERQFYTNSTRNAVQDGNGNLVITARKENPGGNRCHYGPCEYTSARLTTAGKFAHKYGRFEARMKLPRGAGMWPAFWMLGDDFKDVGWPASGQIGIMEHIGREPGTVYGTLHGPGYSGGDNKGGSSTIAAGEGRPRVGTTGDRQARHDTRSGDRDSGDRNSGDRNSGDRKSDVGTRDDRAAATPFSDDFHTFAVDWAPDQIIWYVDDVRYHSATPESLEGNPWVFDHPFFLNLNLAVGGDWPGPPDAGTSFPQSLTVDYVRVTARSSGPTPPTTSKPTVKPPTTPPVTPPTTAPPTTRPPTTAPPTTKPPAAKPWAPFTIYARDQLVTFNGKTYRVLQAHTSLPGWEPPNVPALFELV